MIMQPLPPRVPHDAYNGNTWPRSGAIGATATRPGYGEPSAALPGPAATAAAAARRRSAGGKASPGLERRQRARLLGRLQTFFKRLERERPGSHDGQQGQGPQYQCDMAIPARPAADFLVIQADFPLGHLKATLDGPTTA